MTSTRSLPGKETKTKTAAKTLLGAIRRLVVFHLAGQVLALPLEDVQEIVPMAHLSCPPGLPSVLAGFLNLAGKAVPVLRLDRLFGQPEQPPGLYSALLILRQPEDRMALLVDKVSEILTIGAEAVMTVRRDCSFNDWVSGEAAVSDHTIPVLTVERLLLEKSASAWRSSQAMEQDRLRELEEARS